MTRRLRVINDPDADEVKIPWHPVLDLSCDPPPVLNALMDRALLDIMLTSDGRSLALVERVTGSKNGRGAAPQSVLAEEIETRGRSFKAARTNRHRLYAIKEAQTYVHRLRFAPKRPTIHMTEELKAEIAADPRSCRAIEAIYGVNYRTVARIKKRATAQVA